MSTLTVYFTGQIGVEPARAALNAPEYTLAEVRAAGFINNMPNAFTLQNGSFVFASCSDGSAILRVTNTGKTITLSSLSNPGEVSLIGTAVVNRIAIFANTSGDIKQADDKADATCENLVAHGDIFAGPGAVLGAVGPDDASQYRMIAVNNTGNAAVTNTNASHGQSTNYTQPDIGAATGGIMVSTAPVRTKFVQAATVAGGNAANTITDAFCTSSSIVMGNWASQTNAAAVLKIAPGTGSFVVTSTADPGTSTFSYQITKS